MLEAFTLAKAAEQSGEVPVGSIVVYQNKIIGRGFNQPIGQVDPTAHAEILAMREASKNIGNYRLVDCDLYVTLEPCQMCKSAMIHARIANCYFGAHDSRIASLPNHHVNMEGGILEEDCGTILKKFFEARR